MANTRNLRLLTATALAGALMFAAMPADAYRVAPLVVEVEPTGTKAQSVVRVENTNEFPITIEPKVYLRSYAPDGSEKQTPADDDFLLFPPQSVIQPGQTQAIRMQYAGDKQITETKPYIIVIEQLPVGLPGQDKSGVRVVVNFGVAVNVSPAGATSALAVAASDAGADRTIRVTFSNKGNKFASAAEAPWTITNPDGTSIRIEPDTIRQSVQNGTFIPANSEKREVILLAPEGFTPQRGLSVKLVK
ncbi:MAG: molecular chaperone [Alphaproteobacteria bacterium]